MPTKQRIGFDRQLERRWLDEAASLAVERVDLDEGRRILASRLEREIAGEESRRKTVGILGRIWLTPSPGDNVLREAAIDIVRHAPADHFLPLHYGMTMLAYPFFADAVRQVGLLLRQRDAVWENALHQRVAQERGEAGTLRPALRRVLRSLRNWDVLMPAAARGRYRGAHSPIAIDDDQVSAWLLAAAVTNRGRDIPMADLLQLPELFPFDLTAGREAARRSRLLSVHFQGGGVDLVTMAARQPD